MQHAAEGPAVMGDDTHRVRWTTVAIAALAVTGLALAWRFTPLAEVATADNVITWARRFGSQWWAPLVIIFAYTPACIVMFPRPLITLAAVIAFGPWQGFTYAMSGILLAAAATYAAGRVLKVETLRRLAGKRLLEIMRVLRDRGLVAMTAMRFLPLAPFAVEGLLAGAIRVKLWHLLVGTFLGMLPGTLTATVFGDQIGAGLRDPGNINYWIVGGVVAVFIVIMLAARRWLAQRASPD